MSRSKVSIPPLQKKGGSLENIFSKRQQESLHSKTSRGVHSAYPGLGRGAGGSSSSPSDHIIVTAPVASHSPRLSPRRTPPVKSPRFSPDTFDPSTTPPVLSPRSHVGKSTPSAVIPRGKKGIKTPPGDKSIPKGKVPKEASPLKSKLPPHGVLQRSPPVLLPTGRSPPMLSEKTKPSGGGKKDGEKMKEKSRKSDRRRSLSTHYHSHLHGEHLISSSCDPPSASKSRSKSIGGTEAPSLSSSYSKHPRSATILSPRTSSDSPTRLKAAGMERVKSMAHLPKIGDMFANRFRGEGVEKREKQDDKKEKIEKGETHAVVRRGRARSLAAADEYSLVAVRQFLAADQPGKPVSAVWVPKDSVNQVDAAETVAAAKEADEEVFGTMVLHLSEAAEADKEEEGAGDVDGKQEEKESRANKKKRKARARSMHESANQFKTVQSDAKYREPESWEKGLLALNQGVWDQDNMNEEAFRRWKPKNKAMAKDLFSAQGEGSGS